MLEIFALCSCACLACLWCAIALELTKDKYSRKKFDELFGTNCIQCSKDRGPINTIQCNNNHVLRKPSNVDACVIHSTKRRKNKSQEKKEVTHRMDVKRKIRKKLINSHRLALNSKPVKPNLLNSVSFPYLHTNNNGYAINGMPILPCKVCCRVKNRCECAKTNENVPTFDVTIHNCSCPNLNCQGQQQQQQHYNGSPIRLSYYSMTFDPCQQMPISNINNIPHISNIPKVFKNNIPNVLNIPNISNIPNMTNISNVPNIWKDYTQYYKQIPANFKRKRYFPRKLKGQRNYL